MPLVLKECGHCCGLSALLDFPANLVCLETAGRDSGNELMSSTKGTRARADLQGQTLVLRASCQGLPAPSHASSAFVQSNATRSTKRTRCCCGELMVLQAADN